LFKFFVVVADPVHFIHFLYLRVMHLGPLSPIFVYFSVQIIR